MSGTDAMTDTGAEATGEHDLPDDLYEETEGRSNDPHNRGVTTEVN